MHGLCNLAMPPLGTRVRHAEQEAAILRELLRHGEGHKASVRGARQADLAFHDIVWYQRLEAPHCMRSPCASTGTNLSRVIVAIGFSCEIDAARSAAAVVSSGAVSAALVARASVRPARSAEESATRLR